MEPEGLYLHDISERFERGGAAPRPLLADNNGGNFAWLSGDRSFRAAWDLERRTARAEG
jgi:hypothetical protein